MKKPRIPIIVEATFNSRITEVWKAITNVEEMRHWFFENIPDFKPEIGFEITFDVKSGERMFPHHWKITGVVAPRKIIYNWKYDGYPGNSNVTFEISKKGEGSHLRLIHRVTEDFPQDIPEFRRESCVDGWNYFIQDRLKKYLEKNY
jgi:uncharacterized protein YndB with AHSA1/START domain